MTKLIDRFWQWLRNLGYRLSARADEAIHDELLEAYIDAIPTGRALDLGMGEGDNAVWLARRGFRVIGIDRSASAVDAANDRAQSAGLPLETHVIDIQDFKIEPGRYALILAAAVLHFLLPDDARRLAGRIKAGLQPGGVVIVSVYTVDDPGYEAFQEGREPLIDTGTFYVEHLGGPLHFFGMGELRDWFEDLEILHYAEERHMDLEHGLPHYHSGAFLVARRRDSA
jgi:tellurite methyltransferase